MLKKFINYLLLLREKYSFFHTTDKLRFLMLFIFLIITIFMLTTSNGGDKIGVTKKLLKITAEDEFRTFDLWGHSTVLVIENNSDNRIITSISLGKDGKFNTEDDISYTIVKEIKHD